MPSAKILAVDDDVGLLQLINEMLARQGYEILLAENGQQAIEIAPQPAFLASRGLAYALLDDAALAIADFQGVAAWLERGSGDLPRAQLARYRSWIDTLQAGEDPFTPTLLDELRADFVRSGFVVCDSTCTDQGP